MHRVPIRAAFALGVFALLLPLLAACGGSDSTPTTAPAPTDAATGTAAASTPSGGAATGGLKIGMLVSFTGDLSDFGPAFYNAAEVAVTEINAGGGVLGQPITLVRGDDGTSPQQGVEEARRLIEVEGVNAIIGAPASGVTLPVAESVTGKAGVVQISSSATSPALTEANDDDFLFRTTISDAAQGVILAQIAKEQNYASACTLYTNNAYGQGLSEVFAKAFEDGGGKVTAQVPHEQEQTSYAAELAKCTEGDPDVLVAVSYPESARVYLREAVEQGTVKNFLFVDGTKSEPMFEDLGGQNFEGMYGTAPGALDTDIGKAFDAAYDKQFGQRPELPFLRETYDAVYLIALAAEKAGSTDSKAIRDALRDIANPPGDEITAGTDGWKAAVEAIKAGKDVNYEGAASPADLDTNGDVLKGAIEVWKIEGGKIVVQETRNIDLTE